MANQGLYHDISMKYMKGQTMSLSPSANGQLTYASHCVTGSGLGPGSMNPTTCVFSESCTSQKKPFPVVCSSSSTKVPSKGPKTILESNFRKGFGFITVYVNVDVVLMLKEFLFHGNFVKLLRKKEKVKNTCMIHAIS